MGVKSQASNNRKTEETKRRRKRNKSKFSKRMEKKLGPKVKRVGELPELVTPGILKKRKQNPRSNIQMSNKKKNKLLNALRREAKEKARMDAEGQESTMKVVTVPKSIPVVTDVEMKSISAADVETAKPAGKQAGKQTGKGGNSGGSATVNANENKRKRRKLRSRKNAGESANMAADVGDNAANQDSSVVKNPVTGVVTMECDT